MKKLLVIVCILLSLNVGNAQSFIWAKKGGGTGADAAASSATDANGNTYVTGYFNSTGTFGTFSVNSQGGNDVFLAKYDINGNCLWVTSAGGTGSDIGNGISIDGSGNLYVTGQFSNTATFGSNVLTSAGNSDIFIAKYDVTGNCLWAIGAGGASVEIGYSVSADGSGNCFVTGVYNSTTIFGVDTLLNMGGNDIFITEYSTNGNCIWAKRAGGTNTDISYGIHLDQLGNFYLTGVFNATAFFDAFAVTGASDIFLAKYNVSGVCQWVRKAGGSATDVGIGVSSDPSGNAYLTGYFGSNATFSTFTLTSSGMDDVFTAKYDPSGNCLWVKKGGGTDVDDGHGIVTDPSGNSYVCGTFGYTATFSPYSVTANGFNADVFIVKYDANGNCLWLKKLGGSQNDWGNGIGLDGFGFCYLSGIFQVTSTFGTINLTSSGSTDMYLTKINGTAPPVANFSVSNNNICENTCVNYTDLSNYTPTYWSWTFKGGIPVTSNSQNPSVCYYNTPIGVYPVTLYDTNNGGNSTYNSTISVNGNQWAKGGGSYNGGDIGYDVAAEPSGCAYYTGVYYDSIRFGNTLLNDDGFGNVFLAKYDMAGQPLWARKLGGPGANTYADDVGKSVTVDNNGNVYVTGYFWQDFIVDTVSITGNGDYDIFIAKYDSNGNFIWVRTFGGSGRDQANCVATDNNGNIFIGGGFASPSIQFGNTTFTGNISQLKMFLVELDNVGNVIWANESTASVATGLATDQAGNIFVCGDFGGTGIFGSVSINSNSNTQDGFLAKYNSVGNCLWAASIGGNNYDVSNDVAMDTNGNAIVTGGFLSNFMTVGSLTINNNAPGDEDAFVLKFDNNGNPLWGKSFGGSAIEEGAGVAVDSYNSIYMAGQYTSSSINVGGYILNNSGPLNRSEIFFAKLDQLGRVSWAEDAGSSQDDEARSIAIGGNYSGYIAGEFEGTASFPNSNSITYNGTSDAFIAKIFGQPTSSITANGPTTFCQGGQVVLTANPGNSYSWSTGATTQSITVNSAGSFYVTVGGSGICPSLTSAPISVTVLPNPVISISPANISYCVGGSQIITAGGANTYSWAPSTGLSSTTGASITANPTITTTYTVTGTNASGCSDFVIFTVNVNQLPNISVSSSNSSICLGSSTMLNASGANSYLWIPGNFSGTSITVSPTVTTTFTVTGTDISGCTNSNTIAITVNSLPTVSAFNNGVVCAGNQVTLSATGANTYIWQPGNMNGMNVNTNPFVTTTYTVIGTDVNGCQDTGSTTVSVNPLPTVSYTQLPDTICVNSGLLGLSPGSPSGGSYSGTGVSGNSFDPSISGAGAFAVVYFYTDVNGCSKSDSSTITVNALPNVSMNVQYSNTCINNNVDSLMGSPPGGVFSGTAVTGTNFDPSVAGQGTFTITYTFQDVNGCISSATQTINVGLCTGLENSIPGVVLNVYPSPFTENVIVQISTEGELQLFNTIGQELDYKRLFPGENLLNEKDLASGVYLLKIITSSEIITKKVIKE